MKPVWIPIIFLCLSIDALATESLPTLVARDLSDQAVDLAASLSGKAGILIFGFTKGSSTACRAWPDSLRAVHGADSHCRIISVIQLEGTPGFIVPLIVGNIRSKTPKERYGEVYVSQEGGDAWKTFLGYDDGAGKDDPYLVVVDTRLRVMWKGHGAFSQSRAAALDNELNKLNPAASRPLR